MLEAVNGREGVKLQRANPAEVLICDLIMPDQEGIETIAELKKNFPGLVLSQFQGEEKSALTPIWR